MKHSALRPTFKLLPLALAMVLAQQSLAQTPAPAADAQVVEVTAQKRKERIQDVPLAITAISGAALEERGIESASDLTGAIPNLHMTQAPVSGLIAAVGMRGMAAGQPSIWSDPAVGIYVDGVFVGKNQGALFDIVDIARLEALRGPQGTLFGRNTAAGAINFVTRKPSGVFGGAATLEVGNYGRVVGRLGVDLPQAGIFSASVAVRSEKQDGFIANPNGEAWSSRDRQSARLAVRAQPAKGVTIDYAYDHTDINETPSAGSLISSRGYGSLYPQSTLIGTRTDSFQTGCLFRDPAGSGACFFPVPGVGPSIRPFENPNYPTSVAANSNISTPYQRLKVEGHTLQAEMPVTGIGTLRYIGSVRQMSYGDSADYDGTNVFVFSGERATDYETQSHEVQLVGGSGSLRWVAGAYFFKDDGRTDQKQAGSLLTLRADRFDYRMANFTVGTDAKALYGQVDMDVGRMSFGVGGRYTSEKKSVRAWRYWTGSTFENPTISDPELSASQTFSQFTPSLNALYRLNKDTNVFARYAKGFKSGGFPAEAPGTPLGCDGRPGSGAAAAVNCTGGPNVAFGPEKSTSYELGMKGTAMRGKLQYSANVFRMDVKDFQLSLLPAGSISPTMLNAGKMQTQGLELDASWSVNPDLRYTLAYGYLDAKFKEYKALSATNQPVDVASNSVVSGAPRHTLSFTTNARLANIGKMPLRGIADIRYVAERYTYPGVIDANAANATVGNSAAESLMPALTMVDLRLQLGSIKLGGPGEGELSLFVKNALNQRKTVAHMDISGWYQVGFWSDPRTYGATFTYRW
jgi:iron complex outermembrane receptor protein